MTTMKEVTLPSQGFRRSSDRLGGDTVPVPPRSSSNDGPTGRLGVSLSEEHVIAREKGDFSNGDPGEVSAGMTGSTPPEVEMSDAKERDVASTSKARPKIVSDVVVVQKNVPQWARKKAAKRKFSSSSGEDSAARAVKQSSLPVSAKRGKGRPSTTGEFVGLAKAKERLAKAEREELEVRLETELLLYGVFPPTSETYDKKVRTISRNTIQKLRERPVADLRAGILEQAKIVEGVARIASNLKGTQVKSLQLAAIKTKVAVNVLMERDEDGGSAENAALRKEVSDLKAQVEHLKATVSSLDRTPMEKPLSASALEGEAAFSAGRTRRGRDRRTTSPAEDDAPGHSWAAPDSANQHEGTMLLNGLEDRLFMRLERMIVSRLEGTLGSRGDFAPETQEEEIRPMSQVEVRPSTSQAKDSWSTVVRRGRKPEKVAEIAPKTVPQPLPKVTSQPRATGKGPSRPEPRVKKSSLRANQGGRRKAPPRNAVVTITDLDGDYVGTLLKARQKISLEQQEIKTRRGLTGGYIFEFPGEDGDTRANKFANQLREVFRDSPKIKIARPCKRVELRIRKIVESTTVDEIIAAICAAGGCTSTEVTTGVIQRASDRLGMIWARVPETAGEKILATGRMPLGWGQVTVTGLEARRLQCFRCLRFGHVRLACTEKDRSDTCYRCGTWGHRARTCTSAVSCLVCREQGLNDKHRMGGPACKPPEKKGKSRRKGAGPGAASLRGGQVPTNPVASTTPTHGLEKMIDEVCAITSEVSLHPLKKQKTAIQPVPKPYNSSGGVLTEPEKFQLVVQEDLPPPSSMDPEWVAMSTQMAIERIAEARRDAATEEQQSSMEVEREVVAPVTPVIPVIKAEEAHLLCKRVTPGAEEPPLVDLEPDDESCPDQC